MVSDTGMRNAVAPVGATVTTASYCPGGMPVVMKESVSVAGNVPLVGATVTHGLSDCARN